ncbi:MAG: hypothetical protein P4M09_24280 [Devosia sp.]|nr:hypothetical protein [Devosia sp.]
MSPKHLGQLWTTFSLFLIYYATNSYIVTQGGQPILDAKLVLDAKFPAAAVGIAVCTVMLFLASLVGWRYARGTTGSWHQRIPVVGLKGLGTGSIEGMIYQGTMAVLLALLPLVAILHFWDMVLGVKIVHSAADPVRVGLWDWGWLAQHGWDNPAQICSNNFGDADCKTPATFLPGFEPTLFAVLTALAVAMFVLHWWAVFLGGNPAEKPSLPIAKPAATARPFPRRPAGKSRSRAPKA